MAAARAATVLVLYASVPAPAREAVTEAAVLEYDVPGSVPWPP